MISDRPIVIKNLSEIDVMRAAGRINALVLATMREMIRPGITTGELDVAAEEIIRKHGGKPAFKNYPGPYPFPATITVSVNEELVHGIPGKRKLREGEIVSVDCGTVLDGYVADSAFSIGVGEISSRARRLLEVTEQALFIGIAEMRPGNHVGDVSAAIQKHVEGNGYHVPLEYTGHGVGRQMHEGPLVPNFGVRGLEGSFKSPPTQFAFLNTRNFLRSMHLQVSQNANLFNREFLLDEITHTLQKVRQF